MTRQREEGTEPTVADAGDVDAGRTGAGLEHVEVGGLRVAYRRRGTGTPPLLLLHGAVCDSRVWWPQLTDLADERTVVAWDAPGCGGSSDPPETFRLPEYADCLAGLVGALGLGRPHVLGHSWGSGLALELARRHPSVPASLVLAGGYAGWAGSLPAEEVDRRRRAGLHIAEHLDQGFDPRTFPGLFSDALPDDHAEELARVMSEIRPVGTRVMTVAFAEADLREALGQVAVPTLVLHGEADQRSSLAVAEALHAAIPGSTLAVLPGLGHEAFLESPGAFDDHVRRFLRRVDAGRVGTGA